MRLSEGENGVRGGGVVHEFSNVGGSVPLLVQGRSGPHAARPILMPDEPRQRSLSCGLRGLDTGLLEDESDQASGIAVAVGV